MTLRRARPIRFAPHTLSDSSNVMGGPQSVGYMASLRDLIPDPSTEDVWTCRPGHVLKADFASFSTAEAVSCEKVIGSLVYGMVASTRTPGHDEPFCFNLATQSFIPVAGVTPLNVPATQLSSGDWVPPTMGLCGVNLVVTHPGFDGVTNFFGWFDTANPLTPVWHAGNTTGLIILTTVPAWVAQFSGRAYFGINPPIGQPSVVFTDPLTLNVTNANQALTFGDNIALTAGAGLPLTSQLGGVVQALIVFKGTSTMYQVTGDASRSNLSINALNVATGTLAPNTICQSPLGLLFMSPDGVRYIDFEARVSAPLGVAGRGVNVPFIAPLSPTRACAACTAEVFRLTVQNSHMPTQPLQDFWFDLVREVWSGPHSFPAALLDVYQNEFIVASPTAVGLFSGPVVPDVLSVAVENGATMTWTYQTAVLPDSGEMAMSEIAEMQVRTTATSGTPTMVVAAQDENGVAYNSMTYTFAVPARSMWGSMVWGAGVWGGSSSKLLPRQISFDAPVVYNRVAINITGASTIGFRIGDIFIRERVLGFIQEVP